MGYSIKKFAVSGAISTTIFALFLYFVYAADNAKNSGNTAVAAERRYDRDTVTAVNDIVARIVAEEAATKAAVAHAPVTQIQPAPTAPTTQPIAIPTVAIPSVSPITIPAVTVPTRIAAPTPTAPVQPKPAATTPRTTVS